MITISRKGPLGPLEALELRDELAQIAYQGTTSVTLDFSDVSSIHPSVAAAVVAGASNIRRQTGKFRLVQPSEISARRTLSLISIQTLLP